MADTSKPPRILVLGAHPDDAEIFGGGLICRQAKLNANIKIISVTDGRSGHHRIVPNELVSIRRKEAAASGAVIGVEYVTWDFPDGYLQATLAVRDAIIAEMRRFRPDLVLTHRPCDYHPDHRAVGQSVQDASYLVTVPHIVAEVPRLEHDPVVAYMPDLFTRPAPLSPDVVLEITEEFPTAVKMLACHRSQVFEWLPYHDHCEADLPNDEAGKVAWLDGWLRQFISGREVLWRERLNQLGFPVSSPEKQYCFEAFEVSQYAGKLTAATQQWLFPGSRA
ncbi:MAG: PIG-L family deacetylase [Planctomycetes bacterium]|nr:PIG-L family deacetylase [Planctomycetota bacterium]